MRALASQQCGLSSIATLNVYVDWVCWFSTLHREVFLWVLRFSLSWNPNIWFGFALICWFQFTMSRISTPALDKLPLLPFLPFLSFKHFCMIPTVYKIHALCVNSTRQHSIPISWPQLKCVCYCSWWSNHNRHNSCHYRRTNASA